MGWEVVCHRIRHMKLFGGVLAIAVVTLVLSGCSAPEAKAPVEAAELPTASASPSASIEAAPLAMTAESAEVSADVLGGMTPDEFYLASLEGVLRSVDATDVQLIAAGKLACEQLAAGKSYMEVSVVDGQGEDAEWNNQSIALTSISAYCPQD